jgi:hypothetical protein
MSLTLDNKAFYEGLQKGLVKCALNPRILERIQVDPRRVDELAAAGRTIFNRSYKNPNPLSGIFHTSMAGYGQLRGLHEGRSDFLGKIKALRGLLSQHPEGSPVRAEISSTLEKLKGDYHTDFHRRMSELGAVSEPRRKFLQTTLPTTAGIAGGAGAGIMAGNAYGSYQREQSAANALPVDRLKYLLDPSKVPTRYQAQPAAQSSSATDTAGV